MAGEDLGGLSPEQVADIGIRRRQIQERASLGAEQNTYLSEQAKSEQGRQNTQLLTNYGRMVEKAPWSYAARGMLDSGDWQHRKSQMEYDARTAQSNLEERGKGQQQGFQIAARQLGTVREGGLADVSTLQAGATSAAQNAKIAASAAADAIRAGGM